MAFPYYIFQAYGRLTKAVQSWAADVQDIGKWFTLNDQMSLLNVVGSSMSPSNRLLMQSANVPGGGTFTENSEPEFLAGAPTDYHVSVMPREVLEYLQPEAGKIFLDGTLGAGGHTELLLKAGAEVVALDQDPEAIAHATKRLHAFSDRLRILQTNFRDFPARLEAAGITRVDGILVDLGVSSHQLNDAGRGFSFQHDGPLDMRMSPETERSAANLVNEDSAEELERIFREYGEERQARRIARAIVERREKKAFETTADLASFIASTAPKYGKTHPATLCFQALRIAVNDELRALDCFLEEVVKWLKPGGKLVVISFHSLEDRIVKHTLQRFATEWHDRPEWPEPRRNPEFSMRLLARKPREAAPDEVKRNPRARSAKLRAAEKLSS